MSNRPRLLTAAVWLVSLAAVASVVFAEKTDPWIAALWLVSLAVVVSAASAQKTYPYESQPPQVFSGEDFGVRIHGMAGEVPVGKLVVRMRGQWVEVSEGLDLKAHR